MKMKLLVGMATVLLMLGMTEMKSAASFTTGVLDQEYDPGPVGDLRVGPEGTMQSFTAGMTGKLSWIELLVVTIDGGDRDLLIDIWGNPTSEHLGGLSLAPNEFLLTGNHVFLPIDLTSLGITVQKGNTYFIELGQGTGTTYSVNWDGMR